MKLNRQIAVLEAPARPQYGAGNREVIGELQQELSEVEDALARLDGAPTDPESEPERPPSAADDSALDARDAAPAASLVAPPPHFAWAVPIVILVGGSVLLIALNWKAIEKALGVG